MRRKGLTFREIAEQLGVTYQRAQALCNAAQKEAAKS